MENRIQVLETQTRILVQTTTMKTQGRETTLTPLQSPRTTIRPTLVEMKWKTATNHGITTRQIRIPVETVMRTTPSHAVTPTATLVKTATKTTRSREVTPTATLVETVTRTTPSHAVTPTATLVETATRTTPSHVAIPTTTLVETVTKTTRSRVVTPTAILVETAMKTILSRATIPSTPILVDLQVQTTQHHDKEIQDPLHHEEDPTTMVEEPIQVEKEEDKHVVESVSLKQPT
jgi:hypothetical protein